jgi:hypothetical protein
MVLAPSPIFTVVEAAATLRPLYWMSSLSRWPATLAMAKGGVL